jgi:hypothetical protein
MSLTTGTRIGPYEITSPLGEGGSPPCMLPVDVVAIPGK